MSAFLFPAHAKGIDYRQQQCDYCKYNYCTEIAGIYANQCQYAADYPCSSGKPVCCIPVFFILNRPGQPDFQSAALFTSGKTASHHDKHNGCHHHSDFPDPFGSIAKTAHKQQANRHNQHKSQTPERILILFLFYHFIFSSCKFFFIIL